MTATEKLQEKIQVLAPHVKELWRSGERTKSVCLEVNIDKSEDAIKRGVPGDIKKMTEVLECY